MIKLVLSNVLLPPIEEFEEEAAASLNLRLELRWSQSEESLPKRCDFDRLGMGIYREAQAGV